MKTIYKVILAIFVVVLGINLYAIDMNIGIMAEENTKFLISASASILGILGVFIMNTWGRLANKG